MQQMEPASILMSKMIKQIPRRVTHKRIQNTKMSRSATTKGFDYSLNYKKLNLRTQPELYRVGVGEQGVLLVEPYKSEILPHWKFATPGDARKSSKEIYSLYEDYKLQEDFVGMDMARKFLQMGFTRSRRYANHKSGRKYAANGDVLETDSDLEKAKSAEIFFRLWKKVEADPLYADLKLSWKLAFG